MDDPAGWTGRVLEVLGRIAPEARGVTLDPARPIRDQIDFDSVDFLNFVLALGQAAGFEVPDAECPRLASIAGCVRYLAARAPARSAAR